MWKQVTQGESATSLHQLEGYEEAIDEGQRMRLDLNLRITPSVDIVETLQNTLQGRGMPATVQALGNTIRVTARKGFPWLVILVAAVLGLIVLAILIVSWQFFKEVAEVLPQPVMIVGAIVGIILLVVIALTVYRGGVA